MKYIVHVNKLVYKPKGFFGYKTKTERVEVEAPDILEACKIATKNGGHVSMVWPVWPKE